MSLAPLAVTQTALQKPEDHVQSPPKQNSTPTATSPMLLAHLAHSTLTQEQHQAQQILRFTKG